MSASPAEASAFIRSATTAGERMRGAMVPARGGLMSIEDADALRDAVAAFETLQAEGERLADELHRPWFRAWVEDMRAAAAGPRKMVNSMHPVPLD